MRRGVTLGRARRLVAPHGSRIERSRGGPALWAEYLGALAATAIAAGDLICRALPRTADPVASGRGSAWGDRPT